MFLNIGATLSGFMIIDALGEVQYRAATRPMGQDHDDVSNGDTRSSEKEIPQLLESYSRGWNVNMLVQHCEHPMFYSRTWGWGVSSY